MPRSQLAIASRRYLYVSRACIALLPLLACATPDSGNDKPHATTSALGAPYPTIVSATQPTGFDVTDVSDSGGYTLFSGSPPVWAYLQPGGFVSYPMTVDAAGTYAVQLYYSTAFAGQASNLLVDGTQSGVAELPSTGDWGTFVLSRGANVQLPAGTAVLKLAAASAQPGYNLEGLLLTPVSIGTGSSSSSGGSGGGSGSSGSSGSGSSGGSSGSGSSASSSGSGSSGTYPLAGAQFYVNAWSAAGNYAMSNPGDVCAPLFPGKANLLSKVVQNPQGVWFGNWNSNPQGDVASVMSLAGGKVPIMVVYDIPARDCGGYSSGGSNSVAGYEAWVLAVAQGVGSHKAAVVLEPDALSQLYNPGCLTAAQQADRLSMLSYAVSAFAQHAPNASVYLDAGHEGAIPVADMAQRLAAAGVANAAGFALNVANYLPTDANTTYGNQISALIGNKHFVIDTSRNGLGGDLSQWCNVPNQALGPISQGFGSGLVDAYVWAQNPGNSDGSCNGGPSAGSFWLQQACGLADRAAF